MRYPVIVGPTAGGKSSLAIELANLYAQRLDRPGEIIAADAYQIYSDLHIGTAKPTIDEQQGIPHHLINLVDLDARFTVHDWLERIDPHLEDIESRSRTPIVVGGTNLYIKAFLDGLFQAPEPSQEFRDQIMDMPQPERRAMLKKVDPIAHERIDGADIRRTRRALEIYLQTGTPISELQSQWEAEKPTRPSAVLVGLDWPTDAINRRINQRVREMIEFRLVEEARAIYDSNRFGHQSREAIGYKQLIAHFDGKCTLDEAIERIKIDTRRFAKNQRTWLKRLRQREGTIWLNANERDCKELAIEAFDRLNAI